MIIRRELMKRTLKKKIIYKKQAAKNWRTMTLQ